MLIIMRLAFPPPSLIMLFTGLYLIQLSNSLIDKLATPREWSLSYWWWLEFYAELED